MENICDLHEEDVTRKMQVTLEIRIAYAVRLLESFYGGHVHAH
jgi:hypothetical protein